MAGGCARNPHLPRAAGIQRGQSEAPPDRLLPTPAGVEIDFIVETARRRPGAAPRVVAIEVKRAERWGRSWDKPMRSLMELSGVKVERMIGVYCGIRSYRFDNVQVWPWAILLKRSLPARCFEPMALPA